MQDVYSEKEIAVYRGVLSLLGQGKDLYSLRVSEIANAAGIGKGTVYNYFESKEQILVRTLVFCVFDQLQHLRETVKKLATFREKIYAILDSMKEGRMRSTFQMVLSSFNPQQIRPYIEQNSAEIASVYRRLSDQIDALLLLGAREGAIAFSDCTYARFVFICTLMGFVHASTIPVPVFNVQTSKDYAYKLLCHGLSES